jgi:putative transposase
LKAEAIVLVLVGFSLADAASYLKWKGFPVRRQNVGVWVRQFQEVKDWIEEVPTVKREIVAVDETKIKVNGKEAFFWCAIDVKTREILAVEVSWQRSGLNAIWFLKEVRNKCSNKDVLIITDGAGWYPWACRHLKLKHERVKGGLRNKIERWFRSFKDWARGFHKNFISRTEELLGKVRQRIKMWAGLWFNILRKFC